MGTSIDIKGIHDGLLITLGDGLWNDLSKTIINQIDEKRSFFLGAKVAIKLGDQDISASQLGSFRDLLSDKGISLWAVVSTSSITEQSARNLGLDTRVPNLKKDPDEKPADTSTDGERAIYLNKTLRSGNKICFKGHIIVMGDINPGAEIVASGSIIVWGRILGGILQAGAEGDESAIVCALDLNPTQLRIAGNISISPKRKGKPVPEMARIIDGQVVAESWKGKTGMK